MPDAFVVVVVRTWVAALTAVTWAFTTAAPVPSVTWPVIAPAPSCANSGNAEKQIAQRRTTNSVNLEFIGTPPEQRLGLDRMTLSGGCTTRHASYSGA